MSSVHHRCLAAIMADPESLYASIAEGLTVDAFPDAGDQAVFVATKASAMLDKSTGLDAVMLRLNGMGQESAGVGASELVAITATIPTSAERRALVARVVALRRQSKLTAALRSAVEASEVAEYDWESLWAGVEPHLQAAAEAGEVSRRRTWADMCKEAIRQEREPDSRPIVATGIAGFDHEFSPVRAGQLIALAARPGNGKTALALQLAEHASRAGKIVAFFSLEMAGEDLATRLALQVSGNDAVGDHPRAVEMRIKALERLAKIPNLDVTDMEESTAFGTIDARCRLLATKPNGLGLVVIDYLQLITPPSDTARIVREQQIATMTRRLKLLAGKLKVPVLLLCQLNRESEKENREPRLSDLRESGSIEQDSDRVWFLHPFVDKADVLEAGARRIPILLIQSKCRGGPPQIARKMIFDRPIFKFTATTSHI